ncbi:flavin-containing monooxygenase [Pseudonocardia sp. Cha107L01]|uniref:flavin-containing monooxygenase n=1 Tax=Pseudonocardia sp. Cha107L01 TaxID=3457576 RepID=UPI00403E608C
MHTTTVVIGAGHAGLAMSRRLTERSIDHVVLERGEVANSWRTERWPSLRLLTPNWQTRLPGQRYGGNDPDGFLSMPEVIGFLSDYAKAISTPVRTQTTVKAVRAAGSGYEVATTQGVWHCPTVVLASGPCNRALVPEMDQAVPPRITTLTPMTYCGPDQLADRGVLVVGGSATGTQLAEEIQRSGRAVTLAVGEHVRLPRLYRGRDIFWWMEAAGVLDQRYDEVDDIVRARHVPSPQLIGTPDQATIDLNTLTAQGVRVVGRLGRIHDGVAQFAGSIAHVGKLADLKMNRLLDTFDAWATAADFDDCLDPPQRFAPTHVAAPPTLAVDLRRGAIGTIIWACGYRPDHSWLGLHVFDRVGRIRHDGGLVCGAPGIYLLGTPFLRRRRSSFINGADHDTADLADHLHRFLDQQAPCGTGPSSPKPRHSARPQRQRRHARQHLPAIGDQHRVHETPGRGHAPA